MRCKLTAAVLAVTLAVSSLPVYPAGNAKAQTDKPVMAEIYVSPSGSAQGTGQKNDPLQTMDQAREKVRTMNQNMTGDILVLFEDGEYDVNAPASFQYQDSGTNGFQVIYKAQDGSRPVFSLGEEVTGWTDAGDPEKPGLMKARVTSVENTRQLYVDGEMAVRAKGPFPGNIERYGDFETYTTYSGTHKAYKGYKSNAKEMMNWRNIQDIEFVYDILWVHRISPIQSIRPEGENDIYIEMDWKSFRLNQIAGGNQVHADVPTYIENAYELLDEPGEWYFDEKTKEIYYLPKEGQDMGHTEAIIPGGEQFITLYGEADHKVKDISFEGLAFQYNTWLYPSTYGWPDQQANFAHDPEETENMHGYSLTPQASIETKMSENIRFAKCDFRNIGSGAIGILKGSQGNVVEQCVFQDISGGGILIGGVNINDAHPVTLPDNASLDQIKEAMQRHADDPKSSPHDERFVVKNNTVTNCYFNEIGTEYKGSIAVLAGYTDGTVITHNTIKNVAYSGISVGWGWGFWDQTGRSASTEAGEITPDYYPVFPEGDAAVSRNNIIEYNDEGYCMTKMHDGGGIYTLGDMPGSSISFNSIHNMSSWPGGLYLDEGSGGMKVEGNISYHTPYTCFYNIREFTWGHRKDQPDFKENYWDTAPDSISYPDELADQIGIEKEFEGIRPKELDRVTAPDFIKAGDKVVLEGYFGEEPGKVVLTGPEQPVTVENGSRYLLSWEKNKITFLVPGGVSSGAVYVEAADKTKTNQDKKLTVFGSEKELLADDFNEYSVGKLKDQTAAAEKYSFLHDRITIAEENGSKIMKMTSDGSDTYLAKEADWEDVKISFDYRMDSDTKDFGGIYISPKYQNKDNQYLVNLLPHFRNGVFCQRYLDGGYSEHGDIGFHYEVGTWYSIKMEMTGDHLKIKMWEKGKTEPSDWTGNVTYGGIEKGGFRLQYVDSSGENVAWSSFDNLSVTSYEEGVTEELKEDTSAPVTNAVSKGEQTENGSYINQVKIELKAEDTQSGVAGIKWQLNGGEAADYKEPILISREGEFTLSYFAYDRAGNREEGKELTGRVVQGKVIFEDNFDKYKEGTFKDSFDKGYQLTAPDQFSVVNDEAQGGKVLKIQGKKNTAVRMTKQDSWDGTIMTLDFKYQEALSGIEGLYVSNYYQSVNPDNLHVYPIIPGYGGILLQQNVNGAAREAARLENSRIGLKPGSWYHLKVFTSGNEMALKVWPKNIPEPDGWMARGAVSGLQNGGGLHLSFSAGNNENNFALYDNLKIIAYDEQELEKPADFTRLQEVFEEGRVLEESTDYTEDSLAVLKNILAEAEKLLAREDLTEKDQALLDEMQKAVEDAITGLTLKPADKEALSQRVQELRELDYELYTVESAIRLKNALDAAQLLLDNQQLTILDQELIQEALNELEAGYGELEAAEPDTEPDTETESETETSPEPVVTYQVIFKNYDGSVLSQQSVTKNSAAKAPSTPRRVGYRFLGWNGTFGNITQNLVITAQYKANSYQIAYHRNSGKGTMSRQALTYDKSSRINTNRFHRSGYVFKGWSVRKDGKGTYFTNRKTVKNLTTSDKSTVTLYAQWKKVQKPGRVKSIDARSKSTRMCTVSIPNLKGAGGYQIRYSEASSFKKAKSTYVSASDGKKTIKTLNGLKRKKTYYVKVRAYVKDSTGKRYLSREFCKAKKVKIK